MDRSGNLVISLDLEMLYGLSDLSNQEYWKENVFGGRKAVEDILVLFKKYGIHATWASVGMLMAEDKEELLKYIPEKKPEYTFFDYDMTKIGENEAEDPYHYASSVLKKISNVPNQEIGTHTFAHFYCVAQGQTIVEFQQDIEAAKKIAQKKDISFVSIVFPRNQINRDYFKVLYEKGIRVARGNEKAKAHDDSGEKNSLTKKAIRLLDSYINILGMNCYYIDELESLEGVLIVPSSRFLRPYSTKLFFVEPLKIRRIKKQMKYAAKKGMIFHMWWHPHNFGRNTSQNLENLEKILKYYKMLEKKYGFTSSNMREIGELRNEDSNYRNI